MAKIVGIQKVTGEFEGRPFSGYRLHMTSERKNVIGVCADHVFCKDDSLSDLLDSYKPEQLLGLDVVIYYDQYKKPAMVEVIK